MAMALLIVSVPAFAQDGDMNCPNFESQAAAQQYFEENGGSATNNVDDLDRNNNGVACETNIGEYDDPATDLTPAGDDTDKDTETDTDSDTTQDDQQTDDTEDDVQDDEQTEMPQTGAGGLAGGASMPVGNAATGLAMLVGAGYAVLRRR